MSTRTDEAGGREKGRAPASFLVHPNAWNEIARLGGSIRIHLEPLGCSGTFYAFQLDTARETDVVLVNGSLRICVDAEAWPFVAGGKLDYRENLRPPRFRILGVPHGLPRCACNRSFGREYPGYETEQCQAKTEMPWRSAAE